MLESGAPLQLGLEQGSEGSVGADAWMGSGNRVTDGWWDTPLETVWASLVEEECERRVWLHEKRWRRKKRTKRGEFGMLKIHEESRLL